LGRLKVIQGSELTAWKAILPPRLKSFSNALLKNADSGIQSQPANSRLASCILYPESGFLYPTERRLKMTRYLTPLVLCSLLVVLAGGLVRGEVRRIEITSSETLLSGKSFPGVGPYERLEGNVFFALDPSNPFNKRIVDLDKAVLNREGKVEASANFVVLRPKQPPEHGGIGFLEVSNRGGKASMRYFNQATSELVYGDEFLMRQGLTVIWVGWQFDVPRREGALRLLAPRAQGKATPIEGLVRCDWVVDEPVAQLTLGHRNHQPYALVDPGHPDNVLTVRDGRLSPRVVVPRDAWEFVGPGNGEIRMQTGFSVGNIYELVYRAKDPVVVGMGLAAVRDMMSYAKYSKECPFPVGGGIGFGVSQTGRFLRQFVYQGFNTDEHDRKVFDGLMIHTAGAGRGSFNHRFGQPSRDAHRYSAFFYPTDIFPFAGRVQRDPVNGKRDGLFAHAFRQEHLPRIFYTNTGYEYWGRAASLVHTSLDASADIELFENERVYHLTSAQHFVSRFPPPRSAEMSSGVYRTIPLNFFPTLRSLAVQMVEWVSGQGEPPPSAHPRIDRGTLVPVREVNFPEIPGIKFPKVIHEAYRADYGLRWSSGIVDRQPPFLGPVFPTLVSQLDALGNEAAGVGFVETQVPLATYFPWNLREGFPGGTDELTDFVGTFVPLPRTDEDKASVGDPRPSIMALYGDREDFDQRVRAAANKQVQRGFLLTEDVDSVVERQLDLWDWISR
jgi:hypothetical protein